MANKKGEGGHWYDPETGKQVASAENLTVEDARKNGWVAGITTILKEWAAPGLTIWGQRETAKAVVRLLVDAGKLDEMPEDEVAKLVTKAIEEGPAKVGLEKAEEGKLIHSYIDRHFRGEEVPEEGKPYVKAVVAALAGAGLNLLMVETETDAVSPNKDYGCRGDIVIRGSEPAYIDIKTRDFTAKDAERAFKAAYEEKPIPKVLRPRDTEPCQVVGNIWANFKPGSNVCGGILYLSRTEPGVYYLHQFRTEELIDGMKILLGLVQVFNVSKRIPTPPKEPVGYIPAKIPGEMLH